MGVYGDFLVCFQELMETIEVWTKADKSDLHRIRAVYIPSGGDTIKRRKYTSGNTGLDIVGNDLLQVPFTFRNKIKIGDYFRREKDPEMWRVTGVVDYTKPADFLQFIIERVTGATPEHTEPLPVKGGRFD